MTGRLEWREAEVLETGPNGERATRLLLEVPGWPGHRAGQHVDVRLTAEDGYQAERSYSIASSPGDRGLELGIELLPDGEVSSYLAGEARPGDRFEVRGPIGGYFVWDGPADGDPLLLVGGGSGVVPLVSIARRWRELGCPVPVRLLYSTRSPGDLMYARELAELESLGLDLRVTFTRQAPSGWTGYARRVDSAILGETSWAPGSGQAAYICGPTPFVEGVARLLVGLGHPDGLIRTERFGPTGPE